MKYVYILRSMSRLDQRYFGITSDLRRWLEYHNGGRCGGGWSYGSPTSPRLGLVVVRRCSRLGGAKWGRGRNQIEPRCGVKRAMASERGGSPWARMPNGKIGGGGNRTRVRETLTDAFYALSGHFYLT